MRNLIAWIKSEFTYEMCEQHPTHRKDENMFVGCLECYGEACAEYYKKEKARKKEERIEEMKEAIIRANNEINGVSSI